MSKLAGTHTCTCKGTQTHTPELALFHQLLIHLLVGLGHGLAVALKVLLLLGQVGCVLIQAGLRTCKHNGKGFTTASAACSHPCAHKKRMMGTCAYCQRPVPDDQHTRSRLELRSTWPMTKEKSWHGCTSICPHVDQAGKMLWCARGGFGWGCIAHLDDVGTLYEAVLQGLQRLLTDLYIANVHIGGAAHSAASTQGR